MAPGKPAEIIPPTAGNDSLFKTRQIHRYELAWIRRRHIWTGALGNIYGTLLTPTSVYFTFFCFALGMSKFQFGIMQALTAFAVAAQMFSWVFEELWGNRKYPWYIFCIASRLCYVLVVFSHWIPISPDGIIALIVKYYSLWHVFHISFVARLIAIAVLAVVITKAEIGCASNSNNNRRDIQTDLPNQPNV